MVSCPRNQTYRTRKCLVTGQFGRSRRVAQVGQAEAQHRADRASDVDPETIGIGRGCQSACRRRRTGTGSVNFPAITTEAMI